MSTGATHSGAWSVRPQAHALHAWRNADLDLLANRLGPVLGAWSLDWAVAAEGAGAIVCAAAVGRQAFAQLPWRSLGAAAPGTAWIAWNAQQAAQLARTWFDAESAETPVVSTVVEACRRDAEVRLRAVLHLDWTQGAPEPPPAVWDCWSGAVVTELGCGGFLLVEGGVLERLPGVQAPVVAGAGRQHPLVDVSHAISETQLRLQVRLDDCELELGELQALQVGDVLCLRHGTQAPAVVSQAGGPVLFNAWLARSRGRRAVELAPLLAS